MIDFIESIPKSEDQEETNKQKTSNNITKPEFKTNSFLRLKLLPKEKITRTRPINDRKTFGSEINKVPN